MAGAGLAPKHKEQELGSAPEYAGYCTQTNIRLNNAEMCNILRKQGGIFFLFLPMTRFTENISI